MTSHAKKSLMTVETMKIKKRDGRLDNFETSKISLAIERCFKNGLQSTDEEAQVASIKVSKAVVNILNKKTQKRPLTGLKVLDLADKVFLNVGAFFF